MIRFRTSDTPEMSYLMILLPRAASKAVTEEALFFFEDFFLKDVETTQSQHNHKFNIILDFFRGIEGKNIYRFCDINPTFYLLFYFFIFS